MVNSILNLHPITLEKCLYPFCVLVRSRPDQRIPPTGRSRQDSLAQVHNWRKPFRICHLAILDSVFFHQRTLVGFPRHRIDNFEILPITLPLAESHFMVSSDNQPPFTIPITCRQEYRIPSIIYSIRTVRVGYYSCLMPCKYVSATQVSTTQKSFILRSFFFQILHYSNIAPKRKKFFKA